MPELRKDPIVGRWVIIAPERAKRPIAIKNEPSPAGSVFCPFCEGHEENTPCEILAYRDRASKPNERGWRVRVIPNKFPALQIECELQFGFLDPLDEAIGAQARLQNLGYYHGDLNGETNDEFEEGLQVFQSDFGLPVTGKLDDDTKQKLFEEHDEEHDFPAVTGPPPQEAASPQNDDDIPPDEADLPTEEEDATDFDALDHRGNR